MSDISIDDMNTTLIQYNGSWQAVINSTKQWDGTVHTTGQAGATATFKFHGHLFRVWGTVAGGVGKNLVQLTIDGGPPNITSKISNGSAIFDVVYFETPLLPETFHTAVVTNLQSATNGSSQFELDRFEFITTDATPVFAPPRESASQILSSSPSATASIGSSSSTLSLRAIAGAVIGTLGLIVILLLFLLWRRSKQNRASGGPITQRRSSLLTPYPINYSPSITCKSSKSSRPTNPEKLDSSLQVESSSSRSLLLNPPSNSASLLPSSQLSVSIIGSTSGSRTQAPTQPTASTSYDETSFSVIQRRDSSIHYPSFRDRAPAIRSPSSSIVDMYDNPPPSYWYLKQDNDAQRKHISRKVQVIQPF